MKKQVVLSAMVAVLSSVATIGIWTSITPTSAGGSTQSISSITFVDAYSDVLTVDPGKFEYAQAFCPSGTHVTGGGFIVTGHNGLAVASVVKSFPSTPSADPNSFTVEVVDPEGASPVSFEAKADCIRLTLTVSASVP
ncbi:MAG: hypothetical protein ACLQVK_26885 [Acidimicrobiales bacterium]